MSNDSHEVATTHRPLSPLQRLSSSPRRGSRHDQQESGGESTLADVLRILEADAFEAGRLAAPLLVAAGPALPAGLRGHLATLEQRVLEVQAPHYMPRPLTEDFGVRVLSMWQDNVDTAVHPPMQRAVDSTLSKAQSCCTNLVYLCERQQTWAAPCLQLHHTWMSAYDVHCA